MRAMRLHRCGERLSADTINLGAPGPGQVRIAIDACGVCRTDLHVVDGDLPSPRLPLVPGHEVVGRVAELGPGVTTLAPGDRVGVPWLGWTCGACDYCRGGRENLCRAARFTGYTIDGGYAEEMLADARYCFPLDPSLDAAHAAPLLCAGLIGYRALRLAGPGHRVGLYGFGAAAHILAQVLRWQGREVFAFTRPEDQAARDLARRLGAVWTGAAIESPPVALDCAILFAPVGDHVPLALAATRPGGMVVCAGIHMSDIPQFPYRLLWEERQIRSVANLTRQDALEFLALVPQAGIETSIERHPLGDAGLALDRLRSGAVTGAAVLLP
ncbi:propanol-preferring alcohol dehydrogenase [Dongia mobilis]|uniref:alcohol dehydrogenase n=1 Tax=Dongia mobilis TaxID=578943 RepID=A0A4R6WU60_9PROT|nr:propanol-preferring alcohol dehydrogenase [Dongia mobilis]